jgi:hypothetical protein
MAAWRILGSLALVLTLARAAAAQPYALTETLKPGDCFRVHLDMNLSGELRVTKDGKQIPLPLRATAAHDFPERILIVGKNNLAQKAARSYETARAAITVDGERSERSLRAERQLMVIQREKDQALAYCPAGPLTREELELTGEHFDTLALTGLLPGKAVNVGDTWKISSAAAQALCNLEGLTSQDLVCKLESVQGQVAEISVRGTVNGIETGSLSKLTIQATCRYDLEAHHLVGVEWKQKDERGQGPASPASVVESTTTLKRTAIELPDGLNDVALVSVPEKFEVSPPLLQLSYHDPKGRFDLVYDRKWLSVSQAGDHLVFRLMDDGEFVAQATLTPWTPAEAGKHLSPEEFGEAMAATPGWEQEQVLEEGELRLENNYWGYRIAATGKMDGLNVVQNFYILAAPSGAQAVVVFTMTQALAEKLGTRDLDLIRGIAFKK